MQRYNPWRRTPPGSVHRRREVMGGSEANQGAGRGSSETEPPERAEDTQGHKEGGVRGVPARKKWPQV